MYEWRALQRLLSLSTPPLEFEPSYNVAPTEVSPIARQAGDRREMVPAVWGLGGAPGKAGPINARAESVASRPTFREAFRSRRCIVPASGFYEWQATGEKTKQPWYIYRADGEPLLMAGLWEPGRDGGPPTFTVITTDANPLVAPLHDRMPVILEPESVGRWLAAPDRALLAPAADGVLTAHTVGTRVGNPRHKDPTLIERLA
jgi:putative SOS response-associated peptidase YedK